MFTYKPIYIILFFICIAIIWGCKKRNTSNDKIYGLTIQNTEFGPRLIWPKMNTRKFNRYEVYASTYPFINITESKGGIVATITDVNDTNIIAPRDIMRNNMLHSDSTYYRVVAVAEDNQAVSNHVALPCRWKNLNITYNNLQYIQDWNSLFGYKTDTISTYNLKTEQVNIKANLFNNMPSFFTGQNMAGNTILICNDETNELKIFDSNLDIIQTIPIPTFYYLYSASIFNNKLYLQYLDSNFQNFSIYDLNNNTLIYNKKDQSYYTFKINFKTKELHFFKNNFSYYYNIQNDGLLEATPSYTFLGMKL